MKIKSGQEEGTIRLSAMELLEAHCEKNKTIN